MPSFPRATLVAYSLTACLLALPPTSVWQKPFSEWTQKDAQKIMTDLPWVKKMPMPAAARPSVVVLEPSSQGAPPPSAALGNPSNTTSGTNMTVSASPGSADPANQNGLRTLPDARTPSAVNASTPAPEPVATVSIIWASATPVRLAVLKLQSGVNTPTSGEIERVSTPRAHYVIAIVGFAAPDSDTNLNNLAAKASLSVNGKLALPAVSCTYRKIGNADVYFFRFLRSALPITEADHAVEFKSTFGQVELKHRFDLRSMEYEGQLAL